MVEAQYCNSTITCNYVVMNKFVNELRQWQCVILMLQAADGNINDVPTPTDLPLHLVATSSLTSCQLLAIASVRHKRDILQQDGNGNLPVTSRVSQTVQQRRERRSFFQSWNSCQIMSRSIKDEKCQGILTTLSCS